jgi:uncharacterized RmlC-like cupin family protein
LEFILGQFSLPRESWGLPDSMTDCGLQIADAMNEAMRNDAESWVCNPLSSFEWESGSMISGSGDSGADVDLRRLVEGGDGISVIRGGENCRAWNNIQYRVGLSAKNVGASKLSMNVATIPAGGVAYAHVHVDFELMLYILQGRVRHEYGPGLRQSVENEAGDFIYIEPGVPHEVFNLSQSEPVVAVVARSDASEWENIVPYDRGSATGEGKQPSEQKPGS